MKIGIIIFLVISVLIIYSVIIKPKLAIMEMDRDNTVESANGINEETIFYHEDDFLQIEIVPFENINQLLKEAENIEDFSNKNFDENGYKEIYIREDKGLKLAEKGIKVHELEQILSKLSVTRYVNVTTGIRPGEMESNNTIGYGENYNGLFFDFEFDTVSNIWISGSIKTDKEKLITLLHEIGEKWNLLLMDWNSLELIDLNDIEQIKKYLK